MVLIIFGIVILAATRAFTFYNLNRNQSEMFAALDNSRSALVEFRNNNRRYPCPADITLTRGDPLYGQEDCTLTPTATGRDTDGVGGPDNVLIGSVPFATISPDNFYNELSESLTIDGWGRKITYAVTQRSTVALTFNESQGAISIEDENQRTVIDPPGSAHIALVSHGDNGRGGFTTAGKLVEGCALTITPGPPPVPPPVLTALSETENCDGDATFFSGLRNTTEGSYNDDRIQFLVVTPPTIWSYSAVDQIFNTNPGNVGIGVEDPRERLHIDGNLKAETIRAIRFCNEDRGDCVPPSYIGGSEPAMKCPQPDQAIIAIGEDPVTLLPRVYCGTPLSTPNTGTCVRGYMTGLTSQGTILCTPPAP